MMMGGGDTIIKTLLVKNTETNETMCTITLMQHKPFSSFFQKWKPEDGYRLKFEYDVKSFSYIYSTGNNKDQGYIYLFLKKFIELLKNRILYKYDYRIKDHFEQFIINGSIEKNSYAQLKNASVYNSGIKEACRKDIANDDSYLSGQRIARNYFKKYEKYVDNSGNILPEYKTASIVLEIKPITKSKPEKPLTRISVISYDTLDDNNRINCGIYKGYGDDGVHEETNEGMTWYKYIKDYDVSKYYKYNDDSVVPIIEMSLDDVIKNINLNMLNNMKTLTTVDNSNPQNSMEHAKNYVRDYINKDNYMCNYITKITKMEFVDVSDDKSQQPEQQPEQQPVEQQVEQQPE